MGDKLNGEKANRDESQELIEIQAVAMPTRKALGEAVEAAFLARRQCWDFGAEAVGRQPSL